MVYGFVKKNGGHITVYSEEGTGTSFKLFLPRSEARPVSRLQVGEIPRGQEEVVLVVEDRLDVRDVTLGLLEELGYTSVGVASAEEAIERTKELTRVDLLLSDIILSGGTSGAKLAKRFQDAWPDCPILLMSGFPGSAHKDLSELPRTPPYLEKPFTRAELARKIREALDRS